MVLFAQGVFKSGLHVATDFRAGHRCVLVDGSDSENARKLYSDGFHLLSEIARQDHQL